MTREEAIHELQEDKRLYETEVCHAGDGSPDGRLLEALDMAIEALASNDEAPTVIKCRIALLPEDFKVWAERIRENNPNNNIVVIPYDAECVSGEERADECE